MLCHLKYPQFNKIFTGSIHVLICTPLYIYLSSKALNSPPLSAVSGSSEEFTRPAIDIPVSMLLHSTNVYDWLVYLCVCYLDVYYTYRGDWGKLGIGVS